MNKAISICALVCAASLSAQDGRQIIEESQKRQQVDSQRYEGTLQVIDSRGKVTDKRWQSDRIGSFGNSKIVLRFTAPAEVKGVALLVVNHPDRASDQWMWIPANERERRISLQDRRTRFFGTDFSFEDLEERDVNQYDYKLLGDDSVDGAPCWKIQSKPKQTKTSQYTSVTIWIRKDNYIAAQVESFSKEQLVRRLNYRQIEKVQNIWAARTLDMNDLTRKSRTLLKLEKLQFNAPVKEEDFTVASLRRQ
ncbi:MAG: outer membrane lipoprotein-sorting protein [Bryobacteraceae bacterium]